MLFFILLTIAYNIKILYFNSINRSLSNYLTILLLLAFASYVVCFIVGFIRVKIQDKSLFLSAMFNSSLVDVCVDSTKLYIKYNIISFIIICGAAFTTLMIMKEVI